MGLMSRMRDFTPAFIIGVGAIFVLFMIISDSNVMEIFGQRSRYVGNINGEEITIEQFTARIEQARELYKQQSGQEVTDEQMDMFRDQVWDQMVTASLTDQALKEFGITVSDEEIRNVILAPDPPQFLKQGFVDSLGNFNRQAYEQAIFDERNKEIIVNVENQLRDQLRAQKLQSYLMASVTISDAEVKQKFIDDNVKMTADYVAVDVFSFPDEEFKVSDEDMKQYYNENQNLYKQDDQRVLQYATFLVEPSAEDSASVKNILQSVLNNVSAENPTPFKDLVATYSETPYSQDTVSISTLPTEVAKAAMSGKTGIVGPAAGPTGVAIYNIIASVPSNTTEVNAAHILIPVSSSPGKDSTDALAAYNRAIAGEDFGKLAMELSKDPGSAQRGGELGWFGKGMMVPEFEKACFEGPLNTVQKPVKTSFGWHIIKVSGKSSSKYVVEKITQQIKPSAATREGIYNKAGDFKYIAEKNGFEKEAANFNVSVQETPAFIRDVQAVPGIGYNKNLVEYSFNNGEGTISEPFSIPSGYVVVRVKEVLAPGVKDFEDVKPQVNAAVLTEKKFAKAKQEIAKLKGMVGDNLADAGNKYDLARFATATDFSTSGNIPTVGNDFAFSYAASKLPVGKVSDPVRGIRGYYLIKVISRPEFDKQAFDARKQELRAGLLQERASTLFQQWSVTLKKTSKITDNRYNFFR